MLSFTSPRRTHAYKPWLFAVSVVGFGLAWCLASFGAVTTTIGAGMVFGDWPTSNGWLINPPGWLADPHMRAEHGHRLLGWLVGYVCLAIAPWLHFREERTWLRRLGWIVLGLVVFQALLGGLRVRLVSVDLAFVHGITAQVFLCAFGSLCLGLSRPWQSVGSRYPAYWTRWWNRQLWVGLVLVGGLMAQLALGAAMRHQGAGLAIPFYPHAQADGSFLPAAWNSGAMLNFAHRTWALVLLLGITTWAYGNLTSGLVDTITKRLSGLAIGLLCAQVALGALTIWTLKGTWVTTAHVVNGALVLVTVWLTTFSFLSPRLKGEAPPAPRVLHARRGTRLPAQPSSYSQN